MASTLTSISVATSKSVYCANYRNISIDTCSTILKTVVCLILLDASNRPHHLCSLVYRLPPGFTPKLSSHGNSKEKKAFFATWPSTLDSIKKECLQQGPKSTIEKMCTKAGGTLRAIAPGQLSRSEKQITTLAAKEKVKNRSVGSTIESDDLFIIMQHAHAEDPTSQFIRSIRATDPAIVVADDIQITDMVRFCTSSIEFGILTVDPTFSLGEFDVTPMLNKNTLGVKKVRGQSEAALQIGMYDQKL